MMIRSSRSGYNSSKPFLDLLLFITTGHTMVIGWLSLFLLWLWLCLKLKLVIYWSWWKYTTTSWLVNHPSNSKLLISSKIDTFQLLTFLGQYVIPGFSGCLDYNVVVCHRFQYTLIALCGELWRCLRAVWWL
jgi:hypothetical protein